MESSRRGFLSKLGIGTLIAGTAGIFTLKKEVTLATELDLKEIQKYDRDKLLEICTDMLNAIDGKPVKNSFVMDFMHDELKKGSYLLNNVYEEKQ